MSFPSNLVLLVVIHSITQNIRKQKYTCQIAEIVFINNDIKLSYIYIKGQIKEVDLSRDFLIYM